MVASARKMIGATNPLAAEPGTIRGDFAVQVGRNVVHGSDSPENGERETGAAPRVRSGPCACACVLARCALAARAHQCAVDAMHCAGTHAAPVAWWPAGIWFKEGIVSWDQTMACWLQE